jgi:hypothetical protein
MWRREQRVVLIGGLIVLGLLTSSRALPPLLRWRRDMIDSAEERRAEAQRAEAVTRAHALTLDTLAARKAELVALAPLFLGTTTRANAEGVLATLVSGSAEFAGMRLGSILLRTDTTGHLVKLVQARASLVGDIRGVMSLLRSLERGPELIAVRELSLNQPEPAAPDEKPESLQLEIAVQGVFFDAAAARKK